MKADAAKAGGQIAAAIDAITGLIAQIDLALVEHWTITQLTVTAPAEGSSLPAGTVFNVVMQGSAATDANSQLALQTARATYQAQLDALNAQLAAL